MRYADLFDGIIWIRNIKSYVIDSIGATQENKYKFGENRKDYVDKESI